MYIQAWLGIFGSFIVLFATTFFVVRMREKIKRRLKIRMTKVSEIAMYALGHVTSQGNLIQNFLFGFLIFFFLFDNRSFASIRIQDSGCDCHFLVFLGVHVCQHLLLYAHFVHVNHLPATGD